MTDIRGVDQGAGGAKRTRWRPAKRRRVRGKKKKTVQEKNGIKKNCYESNIRSYLG